MIYGKQTRLRNKLAICVSRRRTVALQTDAEEFEKFGTGHVSYLTRHPLLRRADRLMEAMIAYDIPLRSTVMLRHDFLSRYGLPSEPAAPSADDVGLFMEIVRRGGRFDLLDEVTTYRRMHAGNLSSSHLNRFLWRIPIYQSMLARCDGCPERWKSLLRRALSDAEYCVGEYYWGQEERDEARQHFRNALRVRRANRKAYLGFLYTLLPPPIARILKNAKRLCRNESEQTSGR